jgi:hypothetical protein
MYRKFEEKSETVNSTVKIACIGRSIIMLNIAIYFISVHIENLINIFQHRHVALQRICSTVARVSSCPQKRMFLAVV